MYFIEVIKLVKSHGVERGFFKGREIEHSRLKEQRRIMEHKGLNWVVSSLVKRDN